MAFVKDLYDYILQSRSNGDLIGLHTDSDDLSKFSLGWISFISYEVYLIQKITTNGSPDGFEFGYTDRIEKLTIDAPYFSLMDQRVRMNPSFSQIVSPPECSTMNEMLSYVMNTGNVVNVCTNYESLACGLLLAVNPGSIEIDCRRNDGSIDGREVIPIDSITYVTFGGVNETILEERIKANLGPH